MTTPTVLTNLMAWSHERFPLSQGIFVAVLVATAIFYGQFLSHNGPMVIGIKEVAGFFACWSIFLVLRILDEHKDYIEDCINHPQRVLQSGRIRLIHLKLVALACIVFQAVVVLSIDSGVGLTTLYWISVIAWSVLMTFEFFVPKWLHNNQLVYGLSHMLIIVFILAWLAQLGISSDQSALRTDGLWWLLIMGLSAGCSYELTRKAWAITEEKESITSYRRILGTHGVAWAIAISLIIAIAMSQCMIATIAPATDTANLFIVQIVVWFVALIALLNYSLAPTVAHRKRNELMVSLCMLVIYLMPLIAMLQQRSVQW